MILIHQNIGVEERREKMKGRMKRLVVGLLAAVLAAGPMAMGALPQEVQAAPVLEPGKVEPGTLTIIKHGADESTTLPGAEFAVWQIFSMRTGSTGGYPYEFVKNPEFADVLQGITPDGLGSYSTEKLQKLAGELQEKALELGVTKAVGGAAKTTGQDGRITFDNLDLGYYLVVETKAPDSYVACAPFLVAIPSMNDAGTDWVYSVTAKPKNVQIPFEKAVDTTVQGQGVVTDGTVKVGDYVPYKITTTFPEYSDDYQNVTFTITDTMSKGLKLIHDPAGNPDKSVKVTVNGQPAEAGSTTFEVTAAPEALENAPDLTIAFKSDYIKAHGKEAVTVTYYAQVTKDAVTGTAGNTNTAKLTYTNKPGETSTVTPPDVKVYSFGIEVVKFAENTGNYDLLTGAEFKLYKDEIKDQNQIGTTLSTSGGKINVNGLDEGTYWLVETKAPNGYTLLTNPIKIEIIATNPKNGTFTLEINDTAITAETEKDGNIYQSHKKVTQGIASVAVQNYPGFTLPQTGGMGVTLFLLAGAAGIIVLSIAVMKKKRQ